MADRIPYDNKEALNNREEIDEINKWTDENINSNKAVIDSHADDIEANQAAISSISGGTGESFETRALAMVAPGTDNEPFVVYGEPDFNGQYRYLASDPNGYVNLYLYLTSTDTVTEGSTDVVESGGVFSELNTETITFELVNDASKATTNGLTINSVTGGDFDITTNQTRPFLYFNTDKIEYVSDNNVQNLILATDGNTILCVRLVNSSFSCDFTRFDYSGNIVYINPGTQPAHVITYGSLIRAERSGTVITIYENDSLFFTYDYGGSSNPEWVNPVLGNVVEADGILYRDVRIQEKEYENNFDILQEEIDNVLDKTKTKEYIEDLYTQNNIIINTTLDNDYEGYAINQVSISPVPVTSIVDNITNPYNQNLIEVLFDNPTGEDYRAIQIAQTINISDRLANDIRFSFIIDNAVTTRKIFIAFRDEEGNLISNTDTPFSSTPLGGGFDRLDSDNLVIPSEAIEVVLMYYSQGYAVPKDTVETVYVGGFFAHLSSETPVYEVSRMDYLSLSTIKDKAFRYYLDNAYVNYKSVSGKKWTSYGDSITEQNEWQPYVLLNIKDLTHFRNGVGGSTVTNTDSDSLSNQIRIDTIDLDTDIITIMAGTNDTGLDLGVITDTVDTTFYGAYQIMLDKIYTRIPNAEVVLSTFVHKDNENSSTVVESFRIAIREIALKYKYRLVEMSDSGLNQLNLSTYYKDTVHPNSLGGERMSRLYIQELKKVY